MSVVDVSKYCETVEPEIPINKDLDYFCHACVDVQDGGVEAQHAERKWLWSGLAD